MLRALSCELTQVLHHVTNEANQIISLQPTAETTVGSILSSALSYTPAFLSLIAIGKELRAVEFLTFLANQRPTEDDIENFFYHSQP